MKPNLDRPSFFEFAAWACLVMSGFLTWLNPHERDRSSNYWTDLPHPSMSERELASKIDQAALVRDLAYFGGAPTCFVISLCAIGIMHTQRRCARAVLAQLWSQPAATAEALRASARAAKHPAPAAGPGTGP